MGKGKPKPCPFCGAISSERVPDDWWPEGVYKIAHKPNCIFVLWDYDKIMDILPKSVKDWNRRKEVKDGND